MRPYLYLIIISLFTLAATNSSYAAVTFVDQASNAAAENDPFTQGNVGATSGIEGDFELLTCAALSNGSNSFTDAFPGWAFFEQGNCGDGDPVGCASSFWTKFAPEPNNIATTCEWSTPVNAFAAAVFRYRGNDPNDPLVDIVCNSGASLTATTPSIETPAGSMVARFYVTDMGIDALFSNLPGTPELGKFIVDAFIPDPFLNIVMFGYNEPFEIAGTAPEVSIPLEAFPQQTAKWRACTASIQMPFQHEIPTLNEWGFATFAFLSVAVGIWYLRRKSITA